MGYDRRYEPEEVHQILWMSERRLRPSAPAAHAHEGHPISRHTEQREDPFDRRGIAKDSVFASRKDQVLAVHEALNDPAGQQALATLNAIANKTCKIVFNLTVTRGKIKANVVLNPMTPNNQPAAGPQHYLTQQLVSSIIVIVDKDGAPESWAPLHIQTAFPNSVI